MEMGGGWGPGEFNASTHIMMQASKGGGAPYHVLKSLVLATPRADCTAANAQRGMQRFGQASRPWKGGAAETNDGAQAHQRDSSRGR